MTAGCAPDWPLLVRVEVGVFMVLCQYFSELGHMWQTDGMVPLPETSAGQAVCSTRHLTAFGASLQVPTHAVSFTVHVSDVNDRVTNTRFITLITGNWTLLLRKKIQFNFSVSF